MGTMKKFSSLFAWLLLFALLGLVAFQMYNGGLNQVSEGAAPDFELTTFDGQQIRLSEFQGKVVVINFWASWCIPCREEAPILEAAWQKYRDQGVIFIGVDYLDTEKEALAFIEEFGITYFNGPDTGSRIAQQYRIRGVPETFFVDQLGGLLNPYIGAVNEEELENRLDRLLAADLAD